MELFKVGRAIAAAMLMVALTACQQGLGTIYRSTAINPDLGQAQSLVTDARQRAILNLDIANTSLPGSTDPSRIVCSEPSPDVAASVGAAFGTGVSVMQYGSASLSASQAEALLQLTERTAAIQALRDQMYQVCLAYANGAISGTVYSLHMSRLNDTLVTLVLGETAGGAFGRPLRAIGASGESQAQAAVTAFPGQLDAIQKGADQLAAVNQEIADHQKKIDELNAKIADPATSAADKKAAQDEVTKEQAALDAAQARKAALLELLKDTASSSASSKTATQFDQATAGITPQVNADVADSLHGMQQDFLNDDFSDSFISACMIELGKYYSNKEGLSLFSAEAAADRGVLDEAITKLKDFNDKDHDTAASAIALTMRSVPTNLSYICNESLVPVAQQSFQNHHDESMMKINLAGKESDVALVEGNARLQEARVKFLEELQKAMKACEALSDKAQKDACYARIFVLNEVAKAP